MHSLKEYIRHLLIRFEGWFAEKAISLGNSIVEKERLECASLESRKKAVFKKLCETKIPGFMKAVKMTIMMKSQELWIVAKLESRYTSITSPVTYARGCHVCFLPVALMSAFNYADCLDACLKASKWSDVCWQVPKEFISMLNGQSEVVLVPKGSTLEQLEIELDLEDVQGI